MTDSTSMDLDELTKNVFKKKLSVSILYNTIGGMKTNPRVDKPDFSIGGLDFQLLVQDFEDEEFPYALIMELCEDEKRRLADGHEISVKFGEATSFLDDGRTEKDEAMKEFKMVPHIEFIFHSAVIRYEVDVELKIEDFFPRRLYFVDVEMAKENMWDCKLVLVDDEKKIIYVNKPILASRSWFFRTLFFGSFKEKGENVIDLSGVKEEDFLEYLYCAYPLPIRPFAFKRIDILLRLADRFENYSLMMEIEKFLTEKKEKTSKEKQMTLIWADAYDMTALFRNTLKTMSEAELKKIGSKTYKGFKRQHIELLVARFSGEF